MTEEEKEAVEYLREYIKMGEKATKYGAALSPRYKTILNLIEKQQKEIEKLNGIRNGTTLIYKSNNATYVKQEWARENYIHKDKIREKIEELEKEIYEEDKATNGRCITIGKSETINFLAELLKGE